MNNINTKIDASLLKSMEIIRHCMDAERINIWLNKISKAHEYNRIMLNAMPLANQLWDKNYKIIDCDDETVRLFKLKNKQEFLDHFFDLSPEYQANGNLTTEEAVKYLKKAFSEGKCVFEWMHCMLDGTLLPVEVTLVRVDIDGEDFVATYFRDLREHKKMLMEIEQRDELLGAVVINYAGIIWCVNHDNLITLFKGRYLKMHGMSPDNFEGKNLEIALQERLFTGILESVSKTRDEGNQDIYSETEGKTFRIRTTPIYDKQGSIVNIIGSFDDVTERIRLQVELKTALKEAQDANSAKSNFLAMMSHEMRTPLNAIIGLSGLTLESGNLNGDDYINLEKINNAGDVLLNTVNDILDISKIEAGKFDLMPVDYDIPSLINDAVTQSIMRIESKPIEFILDIEENLPSRLVGDDLRIKQMINNLLSNAFKYTKKGIVKLCIRCRKEDDIVRMIIQVSDTGIGIRNEDIVDLFSDYAKMDKKSNRKIEGTGLGLPITKMLAEMMGGSISVESVYGQGSVFSIAIMQHFVSDDVIGAEIVESLKAFHYSKHKRNTNSRMMRVSMPYARVLVVDDVTTNLDVAKGILKPYGMHVDCVNSGQEAVDIIREEKVRYNAIFMDHMMPEMDGIEATRIIRETGTDYAKNIPIIALTANAIIGNEDIFLNNGFQAFLPKPVEVSRLDAILRQWVRDKNMEENFPASVIEPPKETQTISGHIDGIDLQQGLERFSGDKEAYLNVLGSYATNTLFVIENIPEIIADNLNSYAVMVHGIKGSSQGICAEKVGAMAQALEKAAKAGNIDYVTSNNPDFVKETKKLVAAISDMLGKLAADNPKPIKEKPDRETLLKLSDACTNYKMDLVDEAMAELEAYDYKTGGNFVNWLRESVDKMNFAEIKEKIITY